MSGSVKTLISRVGISWIVIFLFVLEANIMKRCLISIITVLMVLAVACGAFGQDEETPAQRVQGERRAQAESIRQRWQNMSEEERENFRAEMRQRFGGARSGLSREAQLEKIKSIEEQLAKLKAAIEIIPGREDLSRFRDLSVEERTELRQKMTRAALERQLLVKSIEQQLATLRGPGQPQAGRQPSIGELRVIHGLAVKEKATQTANRLERLIARYQR